MFVYRFYLFGLILAHSAPLIGMKRTVFDFPWKSDTQYALTQAIYDDNRKLIAELAKCTDITQHGHASPPLHQATVHEKAEIIALLLAAGADPNSLNYLGETPLCKAARTGNVTIAKMLKEAGADINHETLHGNTPLSYAIKGLPGIDRKKQIGMIEWLMQQGAKLAQNCKNQLCDHELFEAAVQLKSAATKAY